MTRFWQDVTYALRTFAKAPGFTAIAVLVLAVVGVYGVKSYVVAQRTREIGIRMVLGATASDVLKLVMRDGLFLTGTGMVLGLPLAGLVSIAFTKVFVEIGGGGDHRAGAARGNDSAARGAAGGVRGSDRGQTGVRLGSDRGQTGSDPATGSN